MREEDNNLIAHVPQPDEPIEGPDRVPLRLYIGRSGGVEQGMAVVWGGLGQVLAWVLIRLGVRARRIPPWTVFVYLQTAPYTTWKIRHNSQAEAIQGARELTERVKSQGLAAITALTKPST